MTEFQQLIDGRLIASDASFPVINPATEDVFASCPDASRAELEASVVAARRAFPAWAALAPEARRAALLSFAAAVVARVDLIAETLVREQGKPLAQARGEVIGFAHHMDTMSTGDLSPVTLREGEGRSIRLVYRPIGVVGAITPWNVPLILASHKLAHALYAGNSVVLKPSPYTPLSTLLLGEAAAETLPPGVLNILAGGNDLGRWMTEHDDIDRITFTGSVETGKRVMASSAGTLKRVSLELGGNDPAIVLADADLDKTAAGLFRAAFFNSGQVCMAVKRVFAPPAVYDALVDRLTELATAHRVGDGFEEGVEMGPLQNRMQFDKVIDLIEETRRDPRARFTVGGYRLNRPGYFIAPTIVADAEDDMRLVDEEQFGPVLPVLRYDDVDDAVRRANATSMGLCASVWTENLALGSAIAGRIEAGTVWVNHHLESLHDVPFGGFKQSGIGRELGDLGLHSYMEAQILNLPEA